MTYKEAFKANMRPYELPSDSIEFLLSEQGLDMVDDYTPNSDGTKKLMSAVVEGLYQVITLLTEKDTGSTHTYDTDQIQKRIDRICSRYGVVDQYKENLEFIDRTNEW